MTWKSCVSCSVTISEKCRMQTVFLPAIGVTPVQICHLGAENGPAAGLRLYIELSGEGLWAPVPEPGPIRAPITSLETIVSARRFSLRPAVVLLSGTGSDFPSPRATMGK